MKIFNPIKSVCKTHKEKKLDISSKVFRNHKIRARNEADKKADTSTSDSKVDADV